ncbi:glycosyltransferase family 4 protein [Thermoflexibacter ruber]|uniref:Glycosyltransferase involved in cell wall bisynthesis n=1 Tax=Thermoflexibacter ruber TaxID=1003 RepID=A0A1I2J8E2_9BACT|nr:glycosyltransferase family 4 protein [Thermoflexibacter ruber]SFF51015.1 Glycosyltransferase involved in cell wall bisynthesis [Thermoflexibacter ruber]
MSNSRYILIISPNYPPEQGACASRMRYMAQGLSKAGYQIEVLTAMPNYPTGKIFPTYSSYFFYQVYDERVLVRHFPLYPSNANNLTTRLLSMASLSFSVLFSIFFKRQKKPDIVIVQSPPLLLALSAYFLSNFYKARFVLNISDLWPRALLDLGKISKNGLYRIAHAIEKFLYRSAKLCIGQSQEILTYVGQFAPQTPTFLYRTGVDCQLFQPLTFIEQRNVPLKIVYAGLLGIAQGILSICKNLNFKELNAELHIFGDGYEKNQIAKFVASNPEVGISLHEAVKHEEVAKLLPTFDAMLIAQKAVVLGTVPSKIYEAMATGLPILFCGGGEGASLVEQHQLGFVSLPNDFNSLKKNILTLSKMTLSEKQAIGSRSRQLALEEFDRAKILESLLAELKQIK